MASSGERKSVGVISKTKINCFFCGIIDCNKEKRKVSAFIVPKNKLRSWQETVPELTIGHKLCEIHFDPEDIIKGVIIGNQFYPYKCQKLGANAIPKHFLSRKNTKERKQKPLMALNSRSTKQRNTRHIALDQKESIPSPSKLTQRCSLGLSGSKVFGNEPVSGPPTHTVSVAKIINKGDGEVVSGPSTDIVSAAQIINKDEVVSSPSTDIVRPAKIINEDEVVSGPSTDMVSAAGIINENEVVSGPSTDVVSGSDLVPQLPKFERKLEVTKQKLRTTRQQLRRTKIALQKSKHMVKDATFKIATLENSLRNIKKKTLECVISILPKKQQTIIRMFVLKRKAEMKSKTNRAHGFKYDSDFLMQALRLRMKSSKAYRHIREQGLLPLPCPNSLRRLLSTELIR